jgi:two-component system sensor histidine kinase ChiS
MIDTGRWGRAEALADLQETEELEKHKILIVEDDVALARQVQGHLQRAGLDVHVENEGKPGLAFAAEHRIDLVLLDVMLPDMSGYDVCSELRRIYHPWILPVVMMTALGEPKNKLLGFGHGADAYLTKPVATEELIHTVRTMLDRTISA